MNLANAAVLVLDENLFPGLLRIVNPGGDGDGLADRVSFRRRAFRELFEGGVRLANQFDVVATHTSFIHHPGANSSQIALLPVHLRFELYRPAVGFERNDQAL
jgi:hypothetical protein